MIKWHDLEQDSDDLPRFEREVAITYRDNFNELWYDLGFYGRDKHWYFCKSRDVFQNGQVIEWAKVEAEEDTPKPSPKNGIVELHKRLSANAFSIESRLDSTFERLKACEPSFPLGETTLAVKCAMAEMDSNIESAFADFERSEKRD